MAGAKTFYEKVHRRIRKLCKNRWRGNRMAAKALTIDATIREAH